MNRHSVLLVLGVFISLSGLMVRFAAPNLNTTCFILLFSGMAMTALAIHRWFYEKNGNDEPQRRTNSHTRRLSESLLAERQFLTKQRPGQRKSGTFANFPRADAFPSPKGH